MSPTRAQWILELVVIDYSVNYVGSIILSPQGGIKMMRLVLSVNNANNPVMVNRWLPGLRLIELAMGLNND